MKTQKGKYFELWVWSISYYKSLFGQKIGNNDLVFCVQKKHLFADLSIFLSIFQKIYLSMYCMYQKKKRFFGHTA